MYLIYSGTYRYNILRDIKINLKFTLFLIKTKRNYVVGILVYININYVVILFDQRLHI